MLCLERRLNSPPVECEQVCLRIGREYQYKNDSGQSVRMKLLGHKEDDCCCLQIGESDPDDPRQFIFDRSMSFSRNEARAVQRLFRKVFHESAGEVQLDGNGSGISLTQEGSKFRLRKRTESPLDESMLLSKIEISLTNQLLGERIADH
jgi:hypothetical protein